MNITNTQELLLYLTEMESHGLTVTVNEQKKETIISWK